MCCIFRFSRCHLVHRCEIGATFCNDDLYLAGFGILYSHISIGTADDLSGSDRSGKDRWGGSYSDIFQNYHTALEANFVFGMTYSIISAFQVFDQIVAVSQNKLGSPAGATSTMVTYFYANAFQYYDMGYGCAAAIVLFILIMLVSVAQKKLMNDGEGV